MLKRYIAFMFRTHEERGGWDDVLGEGWHDEPRSNEKLYCRGPGELDVLSFDTAGEAVVAVIGLPYENFHVVDLHTGKQVAWQSHRKGQVVYDPDFLNFEESEPGVFKTGNTKVLMGEWIMLGFLWQNDAVKDLDTGRAKGTPSTHITWEDVDLRVNMDRFEFRAPSVERIKKALVRVQICARYFEPPFIDFGSR